MTAVWVIVGIVALIAAILLLNINLIFAFDGKISVKARILFVRIDLLSLVGGKEKKKKKKAEPQNAPQGAEPKKKPKGSVGDFQSFVELIISVAKMLAENLSNNLRINIKRLNITIGADSAEKTALNYAKVSSAASVMLDALPNIIRRFHCSRDITIFPDYTAEHSSFAVEAVFTLKVWHILKILICALNIFNANTRKRIMERNRKKA